MPGPRFSMRDEPQPCHVVATTGDDASITERLSCGGHVLLDLEDGRWHVIAETHKTGCDDYVEV